MGYLLCLIIQSWVAFKWKVWHLYNKIITVLSGLQCIGRKGSEIPKGEDKYIFRGMWTTLVHENQQIWHRANTGSWGQGLL